MNVGELSEEEILMELHDVLTMCAAGRTDGHGCPMDPDVKLDCEYDNGWVKVRCRGCRCGRGGIKFEGLAG